MMKAAAARAQAREAARNASVGEAEGILSHQQQVALAPYGARFQYDANSGLMTHQQNFLRNQDLMGYAAARLAGRNGMPSTTDYDPNWNGGGSVYGNSTPTEW